MCTQKRPTRLVRTHAATLAPCGPNQEDAAATGVPTVVARYPRGQHRAPGRSLMRGSARHTPTDSLGPMDPRGVMFDAGGGLVRPVGGRWNPRYDFEGIVREHHPDVDEALFAPAILVGQRFLDDAPNTAGRAGYHRAMLGVLGVAAPAAELLHRLEAPAGGPTLEPYPDVRRTLDRLERAG